MNILYLPEESPPFEIKPVNGLGLEKHIVNGLEAGPTQTIVVVLYNLNKQN